MPDSISPALESLRAAVRGYEPFLQPDGELHDPVIGEPTQYGTAYHAWCQAVLAAHLEGPEAAVHRERAARGLDAALAHVADPSAPDTISSMGRADGTVGRMNHRDFFWPPILRTYRVLTGLGEPAARWRARLEGVRVERSFRTRPPSNWAAVWMAGEWLRCGMGLGSTARGRFDDWLGAFASRIRLEAGFYEEPGHSNAYDLFTRAHLAEILVEGYEGAHRDFLGRLMEQGLRRSLAIQLSDGALPSAHRSTGQSWTAGVQVAYFTLAARWFAERDAELARRAGAAAHRAFGALLACERPEGPFSPVQNVLPPAYRVGYEAYTADGHYGNLAMGFLAGAVAHGFTGDGPAPGPLAPGTWIEGDPTFRAVARCGPYAAHVNGFPSAGYDGFGLVDLTFGPGRVLQWSSSAFHLGAPSTFLNPGIALRQGAGRGPLTPLAGAPMQLDGPIRGEAAGGGASLNLAARVRGGLRYEMALALSDAGVRVAETTPGRVGPKTLLIPYLRDRGDGRTTGVAVERGPGRTSVRFQLGAEVVRLELEAACDPPLELPYGYENRRGLCGLLRLDLSEPTESVVHRWCAEA